MTRKYEAYRGHRESSYWAARSKVRVKNAGGSERVGAEQCPECNSVHTKLKWNGDLHCHNCGMQISADELSKERLT